MSMISPLVKLPQARGRDHGYYHISEHLIRRHSWIAFPRSSQTPWHQSSPERSGHVHPQLHGGWTKQHQPRQLQGAMRCGFHGFYSPALGKELCPSAKVPPARLVLPLIGTKGIFSPFANFKISDTSVAFAGRITARGENDTDLFSLNRIFHLYLRKKHMIDQQFGQVHQ